MLQERGGGGGATGLLNKGGWGGGGGGGGGNRLPGLVTKQAVEFPQVLASIIILCISSRILVLGGSRREGHMTKPLNMLQFKLKLVYGNFDFGFENVIIIVLGASVWFL